MNLSNLMKRYQFIQSGLDEWKISGTLTVLLLLLPLVKFTFHLFSAFYMEVYFSFLYLFMTNLLLPILHFIPHTYHTNSLNSMNSKNLKRKKANAHREFLDKILVLWKSLRSRRSFVVTELSFSRMSSRQHSLNLNTLYCWSCWTHVVKCNQSQ